MSDMSDDGKRTEDMRTDDKRNEDVRTDETRAENMPTDDMKTDDIRAQREKRDERRIMNERRQKETEAMRTNHEVMGRAEPVAVDDHDRPATEPRPTGRVGGPGEVRATNGGMHMWADMTEFHGRFEQIQSEFIEDPKSAVRKAEKLMEEMLDHMMRSMRERMTTMHRGVEGNADTEQLRLAMRGYKEFVYSFGHRSEAA